MKEIHVSVVDRMHLSDSVKYQAIHEFYQENAKMRTLAIALLLASSGVGLVLWQPWGGLLGFLFGLLGYFLTPYATMRVREIRQG